MAEFGSGPKLDGQFDLDIDNTGDVDSVSGVDELTKDLAFQTAAALDDDIGAISDEYTALRLRDKVFDVISADARVRAINRLTLTAVGNSTDQMRVSADIVTTDGEQELVFEI